MPARVVRALHEHDVSAAGDFRHTANQTRDPFANPPRSPSMKARLARFALLALAAAPLAAPAQDFFTRKPGLWRVQVGSEDAKRPGATSEQCIGSDTDAKMAELGRDMNRKLCSKHDARRIGNEFVVDSVCNPGAFGESTSHSVTTFSGSDAYRTVSRIHYSRPLPGGKTDATSIMEARWVGPCPADFKPGEQVVITPTGQRSGKMNFLDAMSKMR
jgi:hypothetical protein